MNKPKHRPLREERLAITVTSEEKARIEQRAYIAGMTVSAWARQMLLAQNDFANNKEQDE